jgi:hypothetical protein
LGDGGKGSKKRKEASKQIKERDIDFLTQAWQDDLDEARP